MFDFLMSKNINTKRLFFILASLWAIIGPWLFILSNSVNLGVSFDVIDHGRSMLFGFTAALITGYLMGNRRVFEVIWLTTLWLITRIFEVFFDDHELIFWLYAIYSFHLASIVVPRFFSAKKLRNQLLSPTLAIIICFPVLGLVFQKYQANGIVFYMIFAQLLTMLMFFMAGRIISPLLVKANTKKKVVTPHRVQPYIEGTVMGLVIISLVLMIINIDYRNQFTMVLLSGIHQAIALLIFIRIWRWYPWNLSTQESNILGLIIGYIWLALAQIVLGVNIIRSILAISSLHLITIGALGLMSSTIMTIWATQKKQTPVFNYFIYLALISGAATARYVASLLPSAQMPLLLVSVLLWSCTYLLVLKELIKR